MLQPLQIAVIGDMHMLFDDADIEYFNTSEYDALLFVGDLANKNPDSLFRLLPTMNRLTKPAWLIPGNHDTTGVRQIIGEITHNEFLMRFGASSQPRRMARLTRELTGATLCCYSEHTLPGGLKLVAGRPFSMGSTVGTVNFRTYLQSEYAIGTLAESAQLMKSLIDGVNPPYILMAHHGPRGLGAKATDIFGADFLPQETDFGDADLEEAIEYARSIGKAPLAVVAGHMHYPTKHGRKPKQWYLERNGIFYVNAARWPRIFKHEGQTWRHHVRLTIQDGTVDVAARYVSGDVVREVRDDYAFLP